MPVRFIFWPGSADQRLFESVFRRVRATGRPIVLSRQNLAQFGRFRIPAPLSQALGQYACWLDPVIVRESRQLTANWDSTANRRNATKWGAAVSDNAAADRDGAAVGGPTTDDACEWTESRYDTRVALERAKVLRDGGFALSCVWSASRKPTTRLAVRSKGHHLQCPSLLNAAIWKIAPICRVLPITPSTNREAKARETDCRSPTPV